MSSTFEFLTSQLALLVSSLKTFNDNRLNQESILSSRLDALTLEVSRKPQFMYGAEPAGGTTTLAEAYKTISLPDTGVPITPVYTGYGADLITGGAFIAPEACYYQVTVSLSLSSTVAGFCQLSLHNSQAADAIFVYTLETLPAGASYTGTSVTGVIALAVGSTFRISIYNSVATSIAYSEPTITVMKLGPC